MRTGDVTVIVVETTGFTAAGETTCSLDAAEIAGAADVMGTGDVTEIGDFTGGDIAEETAGAMPGETVGETELAVLTGDACK